MMNDPTPAPPQGGVICCGTRGRGLRFACPRLCSVALSGLRGGYAADGRWKIKDIKDFNDIKNAP